MRTITLATDTDAARVATAITKLREARDLLRMAAAPAAAKAFARVLKSADGAWRHVDHRLRRCNKNRTIGKSD